LIGAFEQGKERKDGKGYPGFEVGESGGNMRRVKAGVVLWCSNTDDGWLVLDWTKRVVVLEAGQR
jgi:hypothetical protein